MHLDCQHLNAALLRLEVVQDVDEVSLFCSTSSTLNCLAQGSRDWCRSNVTLDVRSTDFVVSVALSSYGRCGRFGLWLRGRVQVSAIERGVARDTVHHELLELDALSGNVRVSFVPVTRASTPPLALGNDLAVVHVLTNRLIRDLAFG
jgi:hypothetical protein